MSRLPGALNYLPLPIIGSPLFIISNPKLVIAQCTSGVVGSMPALNARPAEQLDEWLAEITETLAQFCDVKLGKGVVRCHDTPGFIANRIGSFWGGTPSRLAYTV